MTPAIKALIIAETLIFVFYLFAKDVQPFFLAHLALGPGFWMGEVWQPVTALLVNIHPLTFGFTLLGLWFSGSAERMLGTPLTVQIFVVAGILANVAMAAVAMALAVPGVTSGAVLSVLALIAAFGRIMGRTEIYLAGGMFVRARSFVFTILGVNALISLVSGDWAGVAGLLVAALIGWALAAGGLSMLFADLRVRHARRHVHVIDGGRRDKPRYLN